MNSGIIVHLLGWLCKSYLSEIEFIVKQNSRDTLIKELVKKCINLLKYYIVQYNSCCLGLMKTSGILSIKSLKMFYSAILL